MLVRKRDRVANSRSLLEIALLVRLQKCRCAGHRRVRRIHVAEHLRATHFHESLAAIDVQLCAQLFSLVAIEDAQRKADTHTYRFVREWVVERWVMRPPSSECWIG